MLSASGISANVLGDPIPQELLPTPDQQRRRRSVKSARTEREDSPQLPLTALQRLSLARKETPQKSTTPSIASTLTTSVPSPVAGGETPKPMSKLALLAQKRREEAQQRASPAPSTPSKPSTPLSESEAGPSKPLSKLAQKMAAARAAKLDEVSKGNVSTSSSLPQTPLEDSMEIDIPEQSASSLFALPRASCRPSPFFNLLTSVKRASRPPDPSSSKSLHLPYVPDEEKLESRVRDAFGPDVESPDDIVLKARGGRGGAAGEGNDGVAVQPAKKVAPVKATVAPKSVKPDGVVTNGGGEGSTKKRKPRTVSKESKGERPNVASGPNEKNDIGKRKGDKPKPARTQSGNQPKPKAPPTPSIPAPEPIKPPRAVPGSSANPPRRPKPPTSISDNNLNGPTPTQSNQSQVGEGGAARPKPKPKPKSRVVQGPP